MSDRPLRELFQSRGLRAGDVAREVGVHKNTVSNWTTGKTPVVPPHLRQLARLLDTSIDELAGVGAAESEMQDDAATESLESDALELLGRLLESAGAVHAIYHAAPSLMDVLRDAEQLVARGAHRPANAAAPDATPDGE